MANDPFQHALDQITELEARLIKLKQWVNDGDAIAGREPRFGDLAEPSAAAPNKPKAPQFSAGQFYNKPFAGAVKAILQSRSAANGNEPAPTAVDEIHEALTQGSFGFETNGADAQKNSIRISLGKNSTTFVKLPGSDLFGLVEWFGKKPHKPRKVSPVSGAAAGFGSDDDDDGFGEPDTTPEPDTETTASPEAAAAS